MLLVTYQVLAQRTISGTVTSDEDGQPIPGVNVLLKGSSTGTTTDLDGKYRISIPEDEAILVFSFIGFATTEEKVGTRSVISIALGPDVQELTEVVVTALGVTREERSLGYAVSEVTGDDVSKGQEQNVVTAMSGKVSGVQIKQPNTFGGSANILIRGMNSLTGNNQPLFVIDGVPVDGGTYNDPLQDAGDGGYDYGNVTQDINPADIESMSILKGASAAALYGSRAMNGVVFITTKKGSKRKGIGVTVSSSVTFEQINKETIPEHQKKYGGGYGPFYGPNEDAYFNQADVDGDGVMDLLVPYGEDASWGAPLDGTLVVQWDALDPYADNFGEKRPYLPSSHGIEDFFETGVTFNNTVAIDGGSETTTFRLAYTNVNATGVLPNSEMQKNIVSFNGTHQLSQKLKASASVSYTNNYTLGRGGTGYDGLNVMQSFGQWFQGQLDFDRLKNYKQVNGDQYTWNANGWNNTNPHYFNNPYWVRNENYQDDERDRIIGNVKLDYQLTDWLSLNGQVSNDYYNYLQEERIAVNSLEVPSYRKKLRTYNETNYQFIANVNHRFGTEFSFAGILGANLRQRERTYQEIGTSGGLIAEGIYAISNSVGSALPQAEYDKRLEQQSIFGSVSLGWKDMIFVDITARNDWSSTLPEDNNSYFYPSISGSFVFTELEPLQGNDILSFGKIRLNYAEVGNDAPEYITNIYYSGLYNAQQDVTSEVPNYGFQGASLYSLNDKLNNVNLKPERQKSYEIGLDLRFLQNRVGLDATIYHTSTFDQILDAPISYASGYGFKWINAGEIENKGVEISLSATPVKTEGFTWNIIANWTKNKNKVVELTEDLSSYQLASGFYVTVNAEKGQPYGVIKGPGYKYLNGKRVVDEDGYYVTSDEDVVLGDANPDWLMGVTNSFSYKGFSLSVLVDVQHGGDVFSQNHMFGRATGLYVETTGTNELGNPMRNAAYVYDADGNRVGPAENQGGVLLDGVTEDGEPNTVRAEANQWGTLWAYSGRPMTPNVFDASYVKLREVTLTYSIPQRILSATPFRNASVSFVGRNLAILADNIDHMDPEATQSAGNIQGFSRGANPSTRTYGFTVKFGL